MNTVIMSKETKKLAATTCKVYGDWYERFILGVHTRIGDQTEPDTPVCIELLHEILKGLKVKLILFGSYKEKIEAIGLGFFLIASFSGGLRG